jgi:hypothetical protein
VADDRAAWDDDASLKHVRERRATLWRGRLPNAFSLLARLR